MNNLYALMNFTGNLAACLKITVVPMGKFWQVTESKGM